MKIKIVLSLIFTAMLAGMVSRAFAQVSSPEKVISLWPDGKMPGKGADKPEADEPDKGDGVQRIGNVSHPTIAIFKAIKTGEPGPAIVVCPGGGYGILAYNKEGTEIAAWLNSIGIAAVVLKYRVPNNRNGALQDVQRAMRLVRAHSGEWNIDPDRLGVLGFSAGGHLAARLSSNFSEPAYPEIDETDNLSCRPDFTVLVYPAYLNKGDLPAPEFNLKEKIPPTLILHNEDDRAYVPGSKVYHAALDREKIANEFHLYQTGGHGYGLRCTQEAKIWPQDAAEWLKKIAFGKAVESLISK